jgi:hypothetical protein
MGRLAPSVLVVCGAGCAQLFGIEQTTGADAPPAPGVSIRIQRMSIGAKVVNAPQDLTGATATYEVPDTSTPSGMRAVPATVSAPGTWNADIPDGTPPVVITLPDYPMGATRFIALPGRSYNWLYTWLEHPNPTPAPAGAMITVNVNTGAAVVGNEAYSMYSLGSWTNRPLPAPAVGAAQLTTTFAFDQPNVSITGRPVEKITTDDAVLVLRYVGNTLTGYYRAPGFDQTGNDTIAGTMTAVTKDQTLAMTIHPGALAARYANVRPAVMTLNMAYYIDAAPGGTAAANSGPQLDAVGVPATDPGNVSLPYGNPFTGEGWPTLVTWASSETRTYTVGNLPVTLYAALNQFVEPGPGLDLQMDAGLPTTISIDQTPLLNDGMTIAIDPTKAVDLSFVPDMPGATLSQIQLFELIPNAANNALQYQFRFSCWGTDPHFVVPADVFVSGHTYTLRAVSNRGGFPGIASGDLTMRALPLVQAYADSGVFTVR